MNSGECILQLKSLNMQSQPLGNTLYLFNKSKITSFPLNICFLQLIYQTKCAVTCTFEVSDCITALRPT